MTDDVLNKTIMVPDVPADLSAVCMGLLRRNPEQRLSGPEALRGLARDTTPPVSSMTTMLPISRAALTNSGAAVSPAFMRDNRRAFNA